MVLISSVAPAKVLLNGSAATVGTKIITVDDAYFYRGLMNWLEDRPVESVEDKTTLKKTVQKMIFEEMVYAELKSIDFPKGDVTQIAQLVESHRKKSPKAFRDLLNRHGRTKSEAIERLYQSQQVERFLQKKVETLTPIITSKEIEQYFDDNKKRFKTDDLQSLKPSIEVLLKKERMRKGLEEWIRFLRDKYGVNNHLAT